MITTIRSAAIASFGALLGAVPGGTGPAGVQTSVEQPAPPEAVVGQFDERLTSLSPDRAREYFRLAEEVADVAGSGEGVDLVCRLYVLAYEVDAGATVDIGPSVCLGLAAIATTPEEGRWLRALARAIDTRERSGPDWRPPTPGRAPDDAAFKLATAIGLIRAGEGRRAEVYMEDPDVARLLDRTEPILTQAGRHPGAHKIRSDMEAWRRCPQRFSRGANQRIVRRPEGTIICPTCGGDPGPRLTMQEFVQQLRYESILLNGAHRAWSAQLLVDEGAPLRDLDPDGLAAFYGVDGGRSVYRDGAWVEPPVGAGG